MSLAVQEGWHHVVLASRKPRSVSDDVKSWPGTVPGLFREDGTTGKRLITDFLEEVQVKSSGYNAEFGAATGGIINVE